MDLECVKYGIFLVIVFTDCEISKIDSIKLKIKELEEKYNMIIQFQYIDAHGNKKSTSKLKTVEENIIKTFDKINSQLMLYIYIYNKQLSQSYTDCFLM